MILEPPIELNFSLLNQVQSAGGFTTLDELQLADRHLGGGNHHGGTLHVTAPVPGFQRSRSNIQNLFCIGNTHAGKCYYRHVGDKHCPIVSTLIRRRGMLFYSKKNGCTGVTFTCTIFHHSTSAFLPCSCMTHGLFRVTPPKVPISFGLTKTRIHSSRMRTVHCSGRLMGGVQNS